jgi:hypothetical protein
MGSSLPGGHEDLDLATDQLSARVSSQAFRLVVRKDDRAGGIGDNDRIRNPFEQVVVGRGATRSSSSSPGIVSG